MNLFRKSHNTNEVDYSGDKTNPRLHKFVAAHLKDHAYDAATDQYKARAFDKPIHTTKATAIYNMHTYWSKKPHDAICQYISHYTNEGGLVLDPFCGSGGTAIAALMEGRVAVAIDISPAATFITKNYCALVDISELKIAFEAIKKNVSDEIKWLYETRCHKTDKPAITTCTVYSQVFQCPRCMNKVPLFDCIGARGVTAKGAPKTIKVCPHCHKRKILEEIDTSSERFGPVPVLVEYSYEDRGQIRYGQRFHNDPSAQAREYFEKCDLKKIAEIERRPIPHWFPKNRMIDAPPGQLCWGLLWRRGIHKGVETVDDFFYKRNLWALSSYYESARNFANSTYGDAFVFALNSIVLAMSRMQGYIEDPRFPNQLMRGTYYIPPVGREYNVSNWLDGKLNNLIAGYTKLNGLVHSRQVCISTQSATDLSQIPDNSVDYIFTDPPYAGNVQYGELNFIWEAWLKTQSAWLADEIIVNEQRGLSEVDWTRLFRQSFAECYRVLKPGRWLSLCYHDTSEGTWTLVQDVMAEVGFIADRSDSAVFIDAKQKSFNQLNADKVNKRDLVINFRKPKPGEVAEAITITGKEDDQTFTQKVHLILREYLAAHPGSSKDRIFDEVVSRMVRAGQMEAHNFEELLRQVADEVKQPVRKNLLENEDPNLFGTHEIGRWYLKETAHDVDDAETAKEDAAAESVTRFIKKAPKDYDDGVHYSDLFEQYIYAVKDKPRRQLADWLLDYFYKTESGTYRLPASEEEERLKTETRAKGVNRRIKRFVAYLEQAVPVPAKERPNDSTLAEWIRNCKRSGLYEEGKLLYEKGGLQIENLTEELQVGVEEDYQVCVRMLGRTAAAPAKETKGKRKKSK